MTTGITWRVDDATSTAVSACGDYTIERTYIGGECMYEGFHRKRLIGSCIDRDAVIQACKDHKAAQVIHVEQRHEHNDGV
jgi:hypothetical protein